MRKNQIKEKLTKGQTVFCGWLHISNTWTAEIMAHAGWDGLNIDLQHGPHDLEGAMQIMQAISSTEATPLARVNWNDPGQIMRLLDLGAYGIICPMVNTKEECQSFVDACYFPPIGKRSLGPTRVIQYAGEDYAQFANEEMLTLAMIETAESVDNLPEILSVKALDGIFIGSGDLRLSLNAVGRAREFDQVIDKILSSCRDLNKIAGIWCSSAEMASEMKAKGFQFISVLSDSMILEQNGKELVKKLKS